jgi:hypothetical protein
LLRGGKLTVPSSPAYDPDVHLSLGDLAIDSHDTPSLIRLTIKQSKTDPFPQVFIGSTKGPECPVQALIEYLGVRLSAQGALFLFESGAPLTRALLVARLQQALQRPGLNPSDFNGHSFRIGAATTAANGLENSLIQILGQWKSVAYIKLPRSQLWRAVPSSHLSNYFKGHSSSSSFMEVWPVDIPDYRGTLRYHAIVQGACRVKGH